MAYKKVTDREFKQCVIEYFKEHLFVPSVEDIMVILGYNSKGTVHDRLKLLEKEGFIVRHVKNGRYRLNTKDMLKCLKEVTNE